MLAVVVESIFRLHSQVVKGQHRLAVAAAFLQLERLALTVEVE
jgi:hypothetical protein